MALESGQSQSMPLEVSDFSGGITDNDISGRPNQYKFAQNYLITDNKKLESRPGTEVYDITNAQVPGGNARISGYLTTDNNFFQAQGRNFYSQISGGWGTLLGPTGNPVLPSGDNSTLWDSTRWDNHYIITSLDYGSPMKIFEQELSLSETLLLANDLRDKFNEHVADENIHTGPFGADPSTTLLSPSAIDLASLLVLTNELLVNYPLHDADAEATVPLNHAAQEVSDNTLSSVVFALTLDDAADRLAEIKVKYNGHDNDSTSHLSDIPPIYHINFNDFDLVPEIGTENFVLVGTTSVATGEIVIPASSTQDAHVNNLTTVGIGDVNTYRGEYIPQYTGFPSGGSLDFGLFLARDTPAQGVELRHEASGQLNLTITVNAVVILNVDIFSFSAVSGQRYEIEISWDLINGEAYVYIDGVRIYINTSLTIGGFVAFSGTSDEILYGNSGVPFFVVAITDSISLFNTIQHKGTTYTPGTLEYAAGAMANGGGGRHQVLSEGDATRGYKVVNAGLPAVTLQNALSMANEFKADFNAHIADATAHTGPSGADTSNTVISPDAFNFSELLVLVNELNQKYILHDDDAEQVTPQNHKATEASDHSLDLTNAVTTLTEARARLDDLKVKYNAHDLDSSAHNIYSNNVVTSTSEPTITGAAGTNQYIYSVVAFYEYDIKTVTFRDFGPAYQQLKTLIDAPDSSAVTVSDIPIIANGDSENYDVTLISWVIYRSENEGTTLYEVGRVTNGTTTFVDTRSDEQIVADNLTLYTTGGVLDNDPPPEARFVTNANNITWYGSIKEGTELKENIIIPSIQFDPDSVPSGNRIALEDTIVGMGAVNIYPIIFCRESIYRLEGFIDELGGGFISKRNISFSHGGINHRSIVNAADPVTGTDGIAFAGNKGFYFTDGFNIIKVSDEFDARYQKLIVTDTQKSNIYGVYDGINDRVYWGVTSDEAKAENDELYVLDLDFGVKKAAPFTTLKSASNSWESTAIAFDHNGTLVLGDKRGFSFKFGGNLLTDPHIDLSIAASSWRTQQPIWDYTSVAMNGGTSNIRKWLGQLVVNLENKTNISLSPQFDTDHSGYFEEIKELRFRDNLTWGDFLSLWQDATPGQTPAYKWNTFSFITEKRRFPKGRLRCTWVTVRFTNAETIITNSDIEGTATVTGTTVTIAGTWPADVIDYAITFESDGYAQKFPVNIRTSPTVVSIIDSSGDAPTGAGQKWHLVGVQKGEACNLNDYTVNWTPLTPSYPSYRASTSGANA